MAFLIVILVIIAIIAFKSIKVVNQSEVYIIERLGKYYKTAEAGLTLILPFIDRVSSVVLLKELTMDIPPQGVITKDNVTINIDTVVFYQITDPEKSVYEIANLKKGIEYLAITTIRDIVGKMDLDETFPIYGIYSDGTENLDNFVKKVEEKGIKFKECYQIGPTIGTHVGPETFGFIAVEKAKN